MTASSVWVALALAWPVAAAAQSTLTTAQLEALATQDAEAAGIPPSVFVAQIEAESAFNPNVGCNSYGACGIAQFIPSTAAAFGIDANDPVASLQAAAEYDAQLEAQNGGSLAAALTAYSGGLTPGNPGDYGPVFAAAEAAEGGTATAGGDGLTVSTSDAGTGNGTLASAAAASGATSQTASGSTANPFTYLWNQYTSGIAQPLQQEVTQVETVAAPYLDILLILMLIAMGTATYVGRMRAEDFLYRAIRMSVVVAFTAVGSAYYQQYVIDLFGALPTVLSNGILGANSTSPAAGFDIVLHAFNSEIPNINWNLPWGIGTGVVDAIIIGICAFVVYLGTSLMFLVWIVAQAVLQILLTLGPIIILALLFDYMRGWFDRWIAAMLLMALVTLATDVITSVILKVIVGYLNPLSGTGQASQDAFNLVGVAVVVIANAVGAPAMSAARNLIAGSAAGAAGAAGRRATKALL
jgi:type IV secretion system protein VirB6